MPTALFQRVTQKIKELTEVIRSTYGDNLVALIVFGSAARGDVHFGSDIDLLLVLEHAPKSQRDRWNEFRQKVGEYLDEDLAIPLSPFILTLQEAMKFHPFYLGIFDACTVFFDRCHLADHILQEIERQKRAGLIEERQLHGAKYWRIKNEKLTH